MTLGDNIRKYRKALKLSQQELAEKIGLQSSAMSKIERGATQNINTDQLNKLCKLFGCTPSDLYGLDAVDVAASEPLTVNQQRLIAIIPVLEDGQVELLLDVVKAITDASL